MTDDPPLIAYLRGCSTDPANKHAATVKGYSTAALRILPRILAVEPGGDKVYALTGTQVKKLLDNYDAHKERPLA